MPYAVYEIYVDYDLSREDIDNIGNDLHDTVCEGLGLGHGSDGVYSRSTISEFPRESIDDA
jgi:hypothetical protein